MTLLANKIIFSRNILNIVNGTLKSYDHTGDMQESINRAHCQTILFVVVVITLCLDSVVSTIDDRTFSVSDSNIRLSKDIYLPAHC